MTIDTNLANWNKENEPRTGMKLPLKTSQNSSTGRLRQISSPARRPTVLSILNQCTVIPDNVIDDVENMQKENSRSPLASRSQEVSFNNNNGEIENEWAETQETLMSHENCGIEQIDCVEDDELLMEEILRLCSWWSYPDVPHSNDASENTFSCKDESIFPIDDQESFYHDLQNYLAKLDEETTEQVAVATNKHSHKDSPKHKRPFQNRENLCSDSDFDLNASF
ncbi:hypothetical protein DdX_01174 [Ditylenchus destructor]|uniref:Uncharacterized protein n=1 Tax=Ditylenchus destructor TaxID=166010 RepID=A0AAD4RDQ6_9BILA|nr:hypothetical protein DdX_01174 [Ditylenchus destructor]